MAAMGEMHYALRDVTLSLELEPTGGRSQTVVFERTLVYDQPAGSVIAAALVMARFLAQLCSRHALGSACHSLAAHSFAPATPARLSRWACRRWQRGDERDAHRSDAGGASARASVRRCGEQPRDGDGDASA